MNYWLTQSCCLLLTVICLLVICHLFFINLLHVVFVNNDDCQDVCVSELLTYSKLLFIVDCDMFISDLSFIFY